MYVNTDGSAGLQPAHQRVWLLRLRQVSFNPHL